MVSNAVPMFSPGLHECSCDREGFNIFKAWSMDRFTLSLLLLQMRQSGPLQACLMSVTKFPSPLCDGMSSSFSRRSRSLLRVQLCRMSAHAIHPFCLASISGVVPCLSARLGCAPCISNVSTTGACPFAHAKCRGVDPEVPTIGASLLLSLENLRGSLRNEDGRRTQQERQIKARTHSPGRIHIRTLLYQQSNDVLVASRARRMQRQHSVQYRIDGLAMFEGILHETQIARSRGRVQTQVGNWKRKVKHSGV